MLTVHQSIMKILCGDWPYAKQLQIAVHLVLILFLANTLAGLTWKFFYSPRQGTIAAVSTDNHPDQAGRAAGTALRTPTDGEFHLFGKAEQATGQEPAAINAPETTMNLELRGVIGGSPMARTLAVISQKGRSEEEVYGVGDQVPGNAQIKEIFRDRVLLLRAGVLETLPLKEDGDVIEHAKTTSKAPNDNNSWRIGKSYLSDKLTNVAELTKEVGVEFQTQGNDIKGFRLLSANGSDMLQKFGLQPGDVIAAVNGIDLNSAENGLKVFSLIQDESELLVVFERDGKRMTRTYLIEE